MILITRIVIEGFRSIRHAVIEPLADFTSFAGLNNSGKSNVLRALNAFFNEETDPGQFIDVDADYYRPDLRKKRRKRIRVGLTFHLPDQFRFRRGLEGVQQLLSGETFSVIKEWVRDPVSPTYSLNGSVLDLENRQKLNQFLQLIKYRYVPNRVLPTELIRNEHQSLRDVLVRRLGQRAKSDAKAFAAIRDTSTRMIKSLTKRFQEACPGEGTVSLATPTSWHDVAFAFGYRLARGGTEIEDAAQGSGIQSLLMLETLYLIDRDYFQQFGWRQAAIWGIEEPESSLHSSLEARVASYLAGVATDQQSRLQVLCTTHSDLVIQYSGRSVIVKHDGRGSEFESLDEPRKALERLSTAGVSRWIHPMLFWPLDPIVLVEGRSDREFLEEAFKHIRPSRPVRVVDLAALDPSSGDGGVDRMRQYVKENASAIRSRRAAAPIVVVLDWDAAGKTEQFRKLVSAASVYKVLAWPTDALNPRAGKSFRGVERAHSDRVFEEAIRRGAHIGLTAAAGGNSGDYIVQVSDYPAVKQIFAQITREGLTPDDLKHARPFIERILREAGAA
jgi:predicted ATPase